MNPAKNKQRAALSWIFLGTLAVLCGVLGVLQYRWIGDVSFAARERLRLSLQNSLERLSQEFDAEINAVYRALRPGGPPREGEWKEEEFAPRYREWRANSRHYLLLGGVGLAVAQDNGVALRKLDLESGVFQPGEWPANWSAVKDRLTARLSGEPWVRRPPSGPPPADPRLISEFPLFRRPPPEGPASRPDRREPPWMIVELDLNYIQNSFLPELLQRHLGGETGQEYRVEVIARGNPPALVYPPDGNPSKLMGDRADASVGLLGPPRGGGWDRWFSAEAGRWQLSVRHRAGSLEAAVGRLRRRNLAVTAAILVLMLLTAGALVRYTRHAQRLAGMQVDFVAGISHEFRTPLTVIGTAAYNLRGRVASNPSQVERYGTLIRRETEKLTALVEQVLRFAGARAGQFIREREPVSVEAVIEDTLESSKGVLEDCRCSVEQRVDEGLPLVLGDAMALKQALQNLLSNAAKYGTESSNWIGLFASSVADGEKLQVEIRVADHGPGIPPEEQEHIFEPFFRGKRALQDQLHGTGLGLSLVKGIIEAHGGTVTVRSEPGKGTEFLVRLPVAPPEYQDEFTHISSRG